MIVKDVIIIWPSTHASIPAGYARETSLDTKYPKATANAVNPNVTGGNNSHSHTSPSHSHTAISHNHTGATNGYDDERSGTDGNNDEITTDAHSHTYNITGLSGGALTDAITYASVSAEPPYYKVIFIKALASKMIPTSAVIYWGSTTLPTNFNLCDGGGGRPDLRNKYLKGADALGDSGATGGAFNHEHSINHTHTGVSHTHSGDSNYANADYDSGGSTTCTSAHSHVIYLNANTAEAGSAYTGNAGITETVEPAYKKVLAIQNNGGGKAMKGAIALWLGTLANVPKNWQLCNGTNGTPDMRDKFLKCANAGTEIGDTGGSNTHLHASSNSHTHTASGTHTHSSGATSTFNANMGGGFGSNGISRTHNHEVTSVSNNTSSWNSTTVTSDSSDNQPDFRTVAYIQLMKIAGGAPLLANVI